jgi:non-heme chloroperoxidase
VTATRKKNLTPEYPRPPGARKQSLSERAHPTAEQPPVRHGFVNGFDGTRLFYSTEGEGIPLVFCYGLVCSSLHWTYQIQHFSKKYKTIWFDYRGHHNSAAPTNIKSITLENIARDLNTVLDELEVKEAVFLGHSMGVNVVLEYYRQMPHRVQAMVLANGTARPPLENLFKTNLSILGFEAFRKAQQLTPQLLKKIWKLSETNSLTQSLVSFGGFNPHLTPKEDIELYVKQVAAMDPALLIQLIESYNDYDASAWLHRIQVPTLVMGGELDKMIPVPQQELMAQLIPNSRMDVIRHGSHCPQMDLPELFNMKIEKFLQEINYVPASNPTKGSASRPKQKHRSPAPATTS